MSHTHNDYPIWLQRVFGGWFNGMKATFKFTSKIQVIWWWHSWIPISNNAQNELTNLLFFRLPVIAFWLWYWQKGDKWHISNEFATFLRVVNAKHTNKMGKRTKTKTITNNTKRMALNHELLIVIIVSF